MPRPVERPLPNRAELLAIDPIRIEISTAMKFSPGGKTTTEKFIDVYSRSTTPSGRYKWTRVLANMQIDGCETVPQLLAGLARFLDG